MSQGAETSTIKNFFFLPPLPFSMAYDHHSVLFPNPLFPPLPTSILPDPVSPMLVLWLDLGFFAVHRDPPDPPDPPDLAHSPPRTLLPHRPLHPSLISVPPGYNLTSPPFLLLSSIKSYQSVSLSEESFAFALISVFVLSLSLVEYLIISEHNFGEHNFDLNSLPQIEDDTKLPRFEGDTKLPLCEDVTKLPSCEGVFVVVSSWVGEVVTQVVANHRLNGLYRLCSCWLALFEACKNNEQGVLLWTNAAARLFKSSKKKKPPLLDPASPNPNPRDSTSMFVDAAWHAVSLSCSTGWVVPSSNNPISAQGTSSSLFVSSPLMAEALAVKNGLSAAILHGFHNITMFSDCLPLVLLLCLDSDVNELKVLLSDFRRMKTSFTSISFYHVKRLANCKAYSLANSALLSLHNSVVSLHNKLV